MNKEFKHIKTTGFKTPKGYFNNLEDTIMSNIKLNETLNTKSTGQKVPDGYFDSLEDRVFSKISNKKEVKVISLFTRKNIFYAASIAAAIVIMFTIVIPSNPSFDNLKLETVENYIFEESYSSEEIAALLSDEELQEIVLIEESYSVESIEDYILDNATLEDLIIE